MASSSSSSSFSSSLPFNNFFSKDRNIYEIFLSFRGSDILAHFPDHLLTEMKQKGILHTYRDDERLERGISGYSELLRAIEESKFAIIIFSGNYTSVTWCDELVKNLEVLSIFHRVDPSDVGNQTGAFADAFAKHEERFKDSIEDVKLGRLALREAASMPQFVLNYSAPESKLIAQLIESLCNPSNQMPEDGSTNLDLPPRFDDSPDEADDANDDADEMVQDYVADLPQEVHVVPDEAADVPHEAHVVPDDVANVPQEARVVEDHVANSQRLCPICDNAIGVAFCCGHLFCVECGDRYSTCPVCRDRVHIRFRVF